MASVSIPFYPRQKRPGSARCIKSCTQSRLINCPHALFLMGMDSSSKMAELKKPWPVTGSSARLINPLQGNSMHEKQKACMDKKKRAKDSFVFLTSDRCLLVLCSSYLTGPKDAFCLLCTAACFECE